MIDALFVAALVLSAFILWTLSLAHSRARLAVMSRVMAWLTLAAAIALPLAVLVAFLDPDYAAPLNLRLYHLAGGSRLSEAVPPNDRMLAFACASVPLMVAVWGLLTLRQLFEHFARHDIFSEATSRTSRALALSLFAFVITAFAAEAPISYFLTRASDHVVTFSLGLEDLVALFAAAAVAVIARVIPEATELADENAKSV